MVAVPLARSIVSDLQGDDHQDENASTTVLPVTIWELGEAAGPLLIAPLSEMYGRYPVINICNMIFIAGGVLAALSDRMSVFIASRAIMGMAVSSNVLGPAVIGDLFPPEHRGTGMSMMLFSTILGGTTGPALGAAVAQYWGWRATLWVNVGLAVTIAVVFIVYFRETYKVVILKRRRAKMLEASKSDTDGRNEDNRPLIGNAALEGTDLKKKKRQDSNKVLISLTRPVVVLCSSSVLTCLSIFGSFMFAQIYVVAVSLPPMLEELYGLSKAQTGAAFMTNGESCSRLIRMFLLYLSLPYRMK